MHLGRLLVISLLLAAPGCHDFSMPSPLPPPQAPLQALGTACAEGAVCESGACADGVCCERACLEHESCVAPGQVGVCTERGVAEACERDAQCASGVCSAGICCEHACEESETCHAPGREGLCTVRGLGEGCARGAECGSGFCADGVCCEAACDAPCHTCRAPGAEGRCELAAPYSDPRGDCAGDCTACYLGLCIPVPAGEPGKCAEGLSCANDGACLASRGEACLEEGASSDALCASGLCAAGACATLEVVPIEGAPMEANPYRAGVVDLAASAESAALLFWEYSVVEGSSWDLKSNDLFFALDAGEGWRVRRLARELELSGGQLPASVAWLGPMPYVARYAPWSNGSDCWQPSGSCGLVGQFFTPAGEPAGLEPVDDMAVVRWVDLVVDGANVLHAVYVADQWEDDTSHHLALSVRARGRSAWEERIELARDPFEPWPGDVSDSGSGAGQARVAVVGRERGVLVVYATDAGRLRAWWKDEAGEQRSAEVTPPAPDGAAGTCAPISPLDAAGAPDGKVLVGFICLAPDGEERTVLASLDPSTGDWSWQWRPVVPYAYRVAPVGWQDGVPYFAELMWAYTSVGWKRASTSLAWTEGAEWRRTDAFAAQGDGAILSFAATPGADGPLIAGVRMPPSGTGAPLEVLVARYRW